MPCFRRDSLTLIARSEKLRESRWRSLKSHRTSRASAASRWQRTAIPGLQPHQAPSQPTEHHMATVSTYLNFNGQTEEAFNFYKSVFGTEFDGNGIMRMGDILATEEMPGPSD